MLADHFDTLERVHEQRLEPTHGPLRRVARAAVGRFLDCGLLEHGFARVRCRSCRAEFLVAHRQVVLTLPKRLRAYFVHNRRRLGLLSRDATRTLSDYVQATLGQREEVSRVIVRAHTFGRLRTPIRICTSG